MVLRWRKNGSTMLGEGRQQHGLLQWRDLHALKGTSIGKLPVDCVAAFAMDEVADVVIEATFSCENLPSGMPETLAPVRARS